MEHLDPLTVPGLILPATGLYVVNGDTVFWRSAAGTMSIGDDTSNTGSLDLRGAASGTRSLAYFVAGVEKWRQYMSPPSTQLFIRDMVNARQMVTYLAGADSDTATMTLSASLTMDGILRLSRNATSYSFQLTNAHATGSGMLVSVGSAGQNLLLGRVNGDSTYRLIIDGNGRMYWGPGGAAGFDVSLYRSAAGVLASDGRLDLLRNASGYSGVLNNPHATGNGWNITLGASTNAVLKAQVTGDAGYRYLLDANGTLWWGPGTGGYDVYLYRLGAGKLQTDGSITAVGGFVTPTSTKTADYTLTASDTVILANATMTATLPSAVTAGNGRQYTVKNRHATATVTLASAAGTIDGVATVAIASMQALTVVSDGTNWWVI